MFQCEKWNSEIREALDSYSFLHDPVICAGVLEDHYANSNLIRDIAAGTAIRTKEETGSEMSNEDIEAVKNKYTKEFADKAAQGVLIYRRQMIIIASTICEAMLFDFIKNHFKDHPEKMFNHVSDDGRIPFNILIINNSKDEMLEHLSKLAAKRFVGRKWSEVLKLLENLLKTELPSVGVILEMLLLRNEIIHEASKAEVSNDKLYHYFEAVQDLSEALFKIAEKT